jgi:hypothetical protein
LFCKTFTCVCVYVCVCACILLYYNVKYVTLLCPKHLINTDLCGWNSVTRRLSMQRQQGKQIDGEVCSFPSPFHLGLGLWISHTFKSQTQRAGRNFFFFLINCSYFMDWPISPRQWINVILISSIWKFFYFNGKWYMVSRMLFQDIYCNSIKATLQVWKLWKSVQLFCLPNLEEVTVTFPYAFIVVFLNSFCDFELFIMSV